MLSRAIPSFKKTAMHIANIFIDHCLIPYFNQTYILIDNGFQFFRKFFAAMYAFFGIKQLATTAYHLQANDQADEFNNTIPVHL